MNFEIPVTGVFDNGKEVILYDVCMSGEWFYGLKFKCYDGSKNCFIFIDNDKTCCFLGENITDIVESDGVS